MMSKPVILILSDLWGRRKNPDLADNYLSKLPIDSYIKYYDSSHLAEIPSSIDNQEELHQHFLEGGIEKAVNNLNFMEPHVNHIIGFSIGGLIGWKYAQSNPIKSLHAISSTRLRNESTKPDTKIKLYFGDQDEKIPSSEWMSKLELSPTILKEKTHTMYEDLDVIEQVCTSLKSL